MASEKSSYKVYMPDNLKGSGSWIMDFFEKRYSWVVIFTSIVFFAKSFEDGLIKGGRWDLYQHIAFADRFLNGQGLYYSTVEASSPYFPGIGLLSIAVGFISNPYRDYILLFIASFIGTVFFIALIWLGVKLSGNKWLSLIVTGSLLFTGFAHYKSYMNEFKGDAAVLLIGFFLALMIDRTEEEGGRIKFEKLFGIFILAFIMDITKQHAVYVDIALGIYLLFTNSFRLDQKIKLLGVLVAAGIVDLIVIFSIIPNIGILTILNLKEMPYWDMRSIMSMLLSDLRGHVFFFILLFVFVLLILSRKLELSRLGIKWLIISMVFGTAEIVGGMKSGGNQGNYETGMVTFLPFVVVASVYIYRKFIVEKERSTVIAIFTALFLIISLIEAAITVYHVPKVIAKINNDADVSEYLSVKFGNETIMYYSDQYMQVIRSTANPGMDVYTTPYYIAKYRTLCQEYLQSHVYKYLYVDESYFKRRDASALKQWGEEIREEQTLLDNYKQIEDPDMPEGLKGQLWVVKE